MSMNAIVLTAWAGETPMLSMYANETDDIKEIAKTLGETNPEITKITSRSVIYFMLPFKNDDKTEYEKEK